MVRGLPVIISDTALDYSRTETLGHFIENVSVNMSGMVQQEACSLETNLMMSSFASVGETFGILKKIIGDNGKLTPWFLSFRNCKFEAVELEVLDTIKKLFFIEFSSLA